MAIIHNLFIKFCLIYGQKGDLMPILHCKIRLCFCYLFQLFLRLLHQKHKIFHQSGYIQHFKWFLTKNIQISKLDQFSGFILKIPLSTHLTNPMVATSVVTYTFYMGQIWWRPWSGWGTSVDWGVTHHNNINIKHFLSLGCIDKFSIQRAAFSIHS